MKTNNSRTRSSSRSNTKNSPAWFSWLSASKPRMAFVAVFGLIGVASLVGVSASEYAKPIDPKQVIAGTYHEKPTVITRDNSTGKVSYASVAESKFVLADGSIICDNGDKTGFVKVGDVPESKLKKIKREAKSVQKDSRVKAQVNMPEVNNAEGVIVSERGKGKNVSFNQRLKKTPTVIELERSLNQYCSQEAIQKIKKEDATKPTLPETKQTYAPNETNLLSKVGNIITPKVSAAPSTPAGVADYNYQANQVGLTNQYRQNARRMYTLTTSGCLDQLAWGQAKRMVERGSIYHNPNMRDEFLWHCHGEGARANNWTFLSENVGRDGGGVVPNITNSQRLFNAYVASPGHLSNIVDNRSRCQGHAAYVQKASPQRPQQVFHVFVSAAWRGGACQR